MEATSRKPRIYWGLLLALTGHAFLVGKALPYAFLPVGSTVYADSWYAWGYSLITATCTFIGIPLAICNAVGYRRRSWNLFISALTILLCVTVFPLPYKLQQVIGDYRQLKTPCDICDGGDDTLKGLYLVY